MFRPQHSLAVMYFKGEGVDQDLNQAFQWMKEAARQGYAPAQHRLALMYEEGEGVDQDLNQYFHWMKKAARQGYAPAQLILISINNIWPDVDETFYPKKELFIDLLEKGKEIRKKFIIKRKLGQEN